MVIKVRSDYSLSLGKIAEENVATTARRIREIIEERDIGRSI